MIRAHGRAASNRRAANPLRFIAARVPAWTLPLLAAAAFLLGLLILLALIFPSGHLTGPLRAVVTSALGWCAPLLPAWLLGLSGVRLWSGLHHESHLPAGRIFGSGLASLALVGLVQTLAQVEADSTARPDPFGGGVVGLWLLAGLTELLGGAGATALLVAGLILGGLLALDRSVADGVRLLLRSAHVSWHGARVTGRGTWFAARWLHGQLGPSGLQIHGRPAAGLLPRRKRSGEAEQAGHAEPADESFDQAPPRSKLPSAWRLPPLSLFQPSKGHDLSEAEIRARARIIEETLASFNVDVRVVEVHQGPTVTQFGLEPAPGVAVNRILARGNDLALRLGVSPIRLEAPVPGKRMVGVEAPNGTVATVRLRELLEGQRFMSLRSRLRLALGQDVTGQTIVGDLTRMPHLLIAGATGSGKSVCINSIVASLIYQSTPDDLQFVMIDPKMVELVGFNGIPHLRMPVVTDMERVVGALKWVVREMERRYALFVEVSARNIDTYNQAISVDPTRKRMSNLVVVIDELADMMMTAADEVERALCRLAQLARATGIHLVVATQRPSVDVITGLIKANFPTRIAFAVTSQVDSRVILDMGGAEKLLGRGDMLYMPTDSSKPIRLQGAYVSDDEIQALVKHWKDQGVPGYTADEVKELESLAHTEEEDSGDEMYDRAVEVASQYRRISISLLQRRLGVGYPRAARLVDLLEERGVVGPSADGKSREVIPSGVDED